jgi:hypothetical protein
MLSDWLPACLSHAATCADGNRTCAGSEGFYDLGASNATQCPDAECVAADFQNGGSCCPGSLVAGAAHTPVLARVIDMTG